MNQALRNTVLDIYDTVADQGRWPAMLDQIAAQVNAFGCIVFEWQGRGQDRSLSAPHFSNHFDPEQLRTYIDRCMPFEAVDQDIFEAHSLVSDGIDLIDDSILADRLEDLKQRKNVQVLQKFGILHRAAGLLNKDNTMQSRFSIQLGAGRGRLNADERGYLSGILPHVAKALDLGRPAQQLALAHQGLVTAMDRLMIGVCILDAKGCIVVANDEFRRQLETHAALSRQVNGVLRMQDPAEQVRFEGLKADALNHGQFGARPRKEAVSVEGSSFLCIEVTPLTRAEDIGTKAFGGFILYSTDTSLPVHCSTDLIQQAYGLTAAELSLVDAMAEGLTNAQIAERRDRSVATINAQVKSILAKTQCATRTQFVRLMMTFGGRFLAEETAPQ